MEQNFTTFLSFEHFRRLFYLIKPSEAQFDHVADVPKYFDEATSWLTVLTLLEMLVAHVARRHTDWQLAGASTNDVITSVNGGQFQLLVGHVRLPFMLCMLHYVHDNWRIVDLPCDGAHTWILCAVWTDLLYYLFHRASHEVGLLWAVHQMHHSSEYYNMSTALRQSCLQLVPSMFWAVANAAIFPVPVVMVHQAFNTLYQFWIHTELVPPLGPLEYIINTPSAHRVHHGRNPYCIDKNYAGTLIIWDRLFGTYVEEKADEKIAYGLVTPVNSFNQLHLQLFELKYFLWDKPATMANWGDKARAVFYPPGWFPGTKLRYFLGWFYMADATEGIPKIDGNKEKPFNLPLSWGQFVYSWMHAVFMLAVYLYTARHFSAQGTGGAEFWLHIVWQVASMQSAGAVFENKQWGAWLELCKNTISVLYAMAAWGLAMTSAQTLFTGLSAMWTSYWALGIMFSVQRMHEKQV